MMMKEVKYEYLDHTADVQLHSWGDSLEEAFEQQIMAMFNYITDLSKVEVDENILSEPIEVEGHDYSSLLYNFMDECLFRFAADYFIIKHVKIMILDQERYKITAKVSGEIWKKDKHVPGTEIKAVTYSNMQIYDTKPTHDIYVIVDI